MSSRFSTVAIGCAAFLAHQAQPAWAQPASPMHAAAVAPVSWKDVEVGGPFWGPRLAALRAGTLAANRHQCDITGRIANFENAARKLKGEKEVPEYQGLLFNDSDVYKMLEGWCYLLATEKDASVRAEFERDIDGLIAKIAAAQLPDGYINTYYTLKAGLDKRMTNEIWDHETYCMGHLIEAGVAHFQATGKRSLLSVAIKAADYLGSVYAPGKLSTPSGHQEIELALIRLAEATGESKYKALAVSMLDMRGKPHTTHDGKTVPPWGDYAQDHAPVVDQREAAGHAVRAGYMYAAMTDLAARGDRRFVPALDAIWNDITQRRIFVTGGIGPSGHNEGFTVPYDIPVNSAYQETCASIALCMWAQRMFTLEPDAKYFDQYEQTLYNAVLAGVSLDGSRFFYVNPMATRGGHQRQDWFSCACCPPNVLRFLGSLGGSIYAVSGDTIYLNLLIENKATISVGGQPVEIEVKTAYPTGGATTVSVRNNTGREVKLAMRQLPGMPQADPSAVTGDGYLLSRVPAGEAITQRFEVELAVKRVYSDPRVKASVGRVAVMRGPLVYAAEAMDNDGSVKDLVLPVSSPIEETKSSDGTVILKASGVRVSGAPELGLYRSAGELKPTTITLRPYYAWGNRKPGDGMSVWIAETSQVLDPLPRPGVSASASFVGHGDGLLAMYDRVLPENAKDATVPRMSFWPKKGQPDGSGESKQWVRYDFASPETVGEVTVWWFDDTGTGECRLPKAFTVEYLDGQAWKPVASASGGTIAIDAPSTLRFGAVTTKSLRLNVTLPDGMSTGILEWGFGK